MSNGLTTGTSLKPLETKIDTLQSDADDIKHAAEETEHHLHSYGRFFEKIDSAVGEVNVAVRIGSANGDGAFIPDAGDSSSTPTWGAWVQLLGSGDTPADSGKTKFDLHRLLISNAERNSVYFMQIGYGESGAAALEADTYVDEIFAPASNAVDSGPIQIQNKRVDVGTKVWVRLMCPGQNTATLNLYPGIHEYDE